MQSQSQVRRVEHIVRGLWHQGSRKHAPATYGEASVRLARR